METIRHQLTLFVGRQDAQEIEHIRQKFNPIQQELIACHVTLCREDEIENLEIILENLRLLKMPSITIQFGQATRFEEGKGVFLPAVGESEAYHNLRQTILKNLPAPIRKPEPHITLIHPRNGTCTDEIFAEIQKITLPAQIDFDKIHLIQQINGGKWEILEIFNT